MDGSVESLVTGGVATVTFAHPKGNSLPASVLRTARAGNPLRRRTCGCLRRRASQFARGPLLRRRLVRRTRGHPRRGGREGVLPGLCARHPRHDPLPETHRHSRAGKGGRWGRRHRRRVGLRDCDGARRRFGSANSRVGIGPFVVGPVVERKIGHAAYGAMTLDADWRSAQWAHDAGLFAQLSASVRALDSAVDDLVAKLAHSNPEASATIKRTLWEGTERLGHPARRTRRDERPAGAVRLYTGRNREVHRTITRRQSPPWPPTPDMPDPLVIAVAGNSELALLPELANRHGCITGATGTGKTITLQVLAESFSKIGVPVFMADVKGDLTGVAKARRAERQDQGATRQAGTRRARLGRDVRSHSGTSGASRATRCARPSRTWVRCCWRGSST